MIAKCGNEAMPGQCRGYAFITPYYKERRDVLERCIESVKRQTRCVDHIVVADGSPQEWVDLTGVRHIRLDRAHADNGNTPRSIGCLIAIAEGYDGIGLLDADCWLEPDHVEHCLDTAKKTSAAPFGFVVAHRTLRRPDESIIDVVDEPPSMHVDTNCFFFLPASYHVLPIWGLMPRQVSSICDRVFYLAMRSRGMSFAQNTRKTVNFTYTYAPLYRRLGEMPPLPIKENPDHRAIVGWINGLPPEQLDLINGRLGTDLRALSLRMANRLPPRPD